MEVLLQGRKITYNYKELKEQLEDEIIAAARNGVNLSILSDLVEDKLSDFLPRDEKTELINSAICIASLNDQKEALATLLNHGKTDISEISNYFLFNEIRELQEALLGESNISVEKSLDLDQ